MTDLTHITIDEQAGKADCSTCGIGVTSPPSFGGIPRSDMLAAFLVQHSVHKAGRPSGLTPTGRVSKAGRAAMVAALAGDITGDTPPDEVVVTR